MKKNFFILFAFILVIQLLVPFYIWQVLIWALAGFIIAFKFPIKRIFIKAFIVELIIAIGLFLAVKGEVGFMQNLADELGVPFAIFPTLFFIVNALTVAFAFQIGTSIKAVFFK